MSRTFFPKDPDEVLDYSIDWSRLLDTEEISSVDWQVFSTDDNTYLDLIAGQTIFGLQLEQKVNTTTIATARFGLGTTNLKYKLKCTITTGSGLVFSRSVFLPIKEK